MIRWHSQRLPKKFVKGVAKSYVLSVLLVIVARVCYAILSSSVVERSTVNRLVAGSNPAWGVLKDVIVRRLNGATGTNPSQAIGDRVSLNLA